MKNQTFRRNHSSMFHKAMLKIQIHSVCSVIRKAISGKSFSFSSVSIKEIVKRIKTLGTTKASKSNDTPIKIPQ